jgi:hypothetical protein
VIALTEVTAMIPSIFSPEEAAFLVEYRALCERHGMCPIVEVRGQIGLLNVAENRIWGCTAGQIVDQQIDSMAQILREIDATPPLSELRFAVGPV